MSVHKTEGLKKSKPRREVKKAAVKKEMIDKVGHSGVYPMSGPHPKGDMPMVWPGSWGQGERGAAGYEDHGESELIISRVSPEKCRDIMSKDPACCQAGDTVASAGKLMQARDIGVLPVVEDRHTGKLTGIITDRDLAIRVLAAGRDPHTTTVREIMSQPVVTCSPDDDYQVALNLMERHQLKRIPAIDNSGRVVGMISQADIALRVPDAAKVAEVVTCISQPR